MIKQFILGSTLFFLSTSLRAETPKYFLRDPILVGRAWGYSDKNLFYNDAYEKKGKWVVRFDGQAFSMLTGGSGSGIQVKRVIPSLSVQGKAILLVENSGATYVFETEDFGNAWRLIKSPGDAPKPSTETKRVEPPTKSGGEAVNLGADSGAIDLGSLNTGSAVAQTGATAAAANSSPAPIFKIFFDLMLHLRPGVSSWTFDNYHSLLLIDFLPRPEMQFSFEVNPSPRYYEFDYDIAKAWQLRIGKIWIPFDDLNPHNTFGGLVNTSKMRAPQASPFLPDIWSDYGVGVKWKATDTTQLTTTAHLYLVNGFQSGGTDPTGQTSAYPNFAGSSGIDNNTDKAIGGRLHFLMMQTIGLGASFYTCRYTDEGSEAKRMMFFGLDGSLRLKTGTSLRGGYMYQKIQLPSTSEKSEFLRGGAYVEGSQRFKRHYFLSGRFGVQQADDRVTDLNDQTWVTGRLGYETDIWQLYLIVAKDINDTPDKSYKDFSGLRFVVTL